MREDMTACCPICHRRMRRADGRTYTRHITKCRIRQSKRQAQQRVKEGLPLCR